MTTTPHYLLPLVESFEKNANPEIAVQMKQYMRNQFDFYGIKSPERKEIYKEFKKDN
ncbi:MAG: DNA alkylation repair protein [Bacteroidetes bacterium]|nr:DNA alkylation repair protein [Bacteroidota bacterium]